MPKEDADFHNYQSAEIPRERRERSEPYGSASREILEGNQEEGKTSSELEKVRYRLVKKKPEKRRMFQQHQSYFTGRLGLYL